MLNSHLRYLDFLSQEIGRMDEEVDSRMTPFEEVIRWLM
jgi:hypothetical protein